jgi:dTDP-4-dehydrorhamnose 3,5-epimerase-like enzyme
LLGLESTFKESYFSVSKQKILRGIHYQKFPHGHAKLISVIEGEILDVVVGIGAERNARYRGKFFLLFFRSIIIDRYIF